MPILNVRALPQKDPKKIEEALKKTCVAIAEAYGCKSEQVWGTWQEIQPGFYVEGDSRADVQPADTHPPIGQLLCFEGKSPEVVEKVLLAASQTLSRELGIPENIFISYEETKSGFVIAGNGVIRLKARK